MAKSILNLNQTFLKNMGFFVIIFCDAINNHQSIKNVNKGETEHQPDILSLMKHIQTANQAV